MAFVEDEFGNVFDNEPGAWPADGSVGASALSVDQLSAITADMGTLTAGTVKDVLNRILLELSEKRLRVNDGTYDRVLVGAIGGGDYGLKVVSPAGTVIIDGSSDMFRIAASGTLFCSAAAGATDTDEDVLTGLGDPGGQLAILGYVGYTQYPTEPRYMGGFAFAVDEYAAETSGGSPTYGFLAPYAITRLSTKYASSTEVVTLEHQNGIGGFTPNSYATYYVLEQVSV